MHHGRNRWPFSTADVYDLQREPTHEHNEENVPFNHMVARIACSLIVIPDCYPLIYHSKCFTNTGRLLSVLSLLGEMPFYTLMGEYRI